MIFARRAIQKRLDDLRAVVGDEPVDGIVARLNVPGRDRLAAMWEVAVFHGLSQVGAFETERALSTEKRPDVWFSSSGISFIADVTTASDEGLSDQNPHADLVALIEKEKNKLGLPMGGLEMQVHSRREVRSRGIRTFLKLPAKAKIPNFIRNEVTPRLREQLASGASILRIAIDDEEVEMDIVIDPAKSPYVSYGFTAYDVPRIKDRNPLYGALKQKADQLRDAPGIKGVILGDGDCAALTDRSSSRHGVTAEAIASELLRQYSSLDFVLLLTVSEDRRPFFPPTKPTLRAHSKLIFQDGCNHRRELEAVFGAMLAKFPVPVNMAVNGALRAREASYETGHHGGYCMSKQKIRIGSRELIELLAGLRTLDDNGAKNVEAARRLPGRPNPVKAAFLRQLTEGRLPSRIDVQRTDENGNDDWIEFEFDEPDPAIAPFR